MVLVSAFPALQCVSASAGETAVTAGNFPASSVGVNSRRGESGVCQTRVCRGCDECLFGNIHLRAMNVFGSDVCIRPFSLGGGSGCLTPG